MDQQQPEDRTYHAAVPNGDPGTAVPAYGAPQPPYTQPQPQPDPYQQQQPPPPPYGYAQPQPIYVTQQVQMAPAYVATAPPKSMAAALLLTFFFGPLGLFYVSVVGGLVMLVVSIVVAAITFGFGLLVTAPICMVWAAIATNNYNNRLTGPQHFTQNAR